MVHLVVVPSNPASTLPPAAFRTRCPGCGIFSPWGRVCASCLTVMSECAPVIKQPAPAPLNSLQVVLSVDVASPVGMCDVEVLVGPDAADAADVLTAEEYIAQLRRAISHLTVYVDDFATALNAEAVH